jgi:imidazolonepropionase
LAEYSLILNGTITTSLAKKEAPLTKHDLNQCQEILTGAIAFADKILKIGTTELVLKEFPTAGAKAVYDVTGKLVLPGFVDSHTHLSFAGTREKELEWKLEGYSYREIAAKGGGILSTTTKTRETNIEAIVSSSRNYLDQMLRNGTTTIEAKSGYGLETKTELKQLEVLSSLNRDHPIDIIPTFLGAHAVPLESDAVTYTQIIIDEMLPNIARQGIAKYIDVFCDEGYFSTKLTKAIVEAGAHYGLKPKIHVDEIAENFCGSELAGELKAVSADHLLQISDKGISALAKNNVIGTLLPGTPFVLRMKKYPPAKKMIESGVPLALATDFNPNCMLMSLPVTMALACYQMELKPLEALNAATLNAAWAIEKADSIGSLAVGKQADIIVLDCPDIRFIPYLLGQVPTLFVFKRGQLVVHEGRILSHLPKK